jgi:hypothetical protein
MLCATDAASVHEILNQASDADWVAYIQPPPKDISNPADVVKYLARYMTGGPISDKRLLEVKDDRVFFLARSRDKSGGPARRPWNWNRTSPVRVGGSCSTVQTILNVSSGWGADNEAFDPCPATALFEHRDRGRIPSGSCDLGVAPRRFHFSGLAIPTTGIFRVRRCTPIPQLHVA